MLIGRHILLPIFVAATCVILAAGTSAAKDGEHNGDSRSESAQESRSDSQHGSDSDSRGGNENNRVAGSDQKSNSADNHGSSSDSELPRSEMSIIHDDAAVYSRPVSTQNDAVTFNARQSDQDHAVAAAGKGEIISLKDILREVANRYDGKVIEINLRSSGTSEIYQMKLRTPDGTIKILKMDARTGKFAGLFGF